MNSYLLKVRSVGFLQPIVFAAAILALLHPGNAQQGTCANLNECYNRLKLIEDQFPVPASSRGIQMGTFNAATGNFTGNSSSIASQRFNCSGAKNSTTTVRQGDYLVTTEEECESGKGYKTVERLFAPEIDAVNVVLTFRLTGAATGSVTTIGGGRTLSASFSGGVATVNLGTASGANWKIVASGKSFASDMEIERPPIIGVGVFTIPVLPAVLLYEPPPDSHRQNQATYLNSKSVCQTRWVSMVTENTSGKPTDVGVPGLSNLNTIKTTLNDISAVGSKIPNVYAQAIAAVAGILGSQVDPAFGTVNGYREDGSQHAAEQGNTVCMDETVSLNTGANDGGPGIGDVIYYWRNVKMIWLANQGQVLLAVLGGDTGQTSAKTLQDYLNAHDTAHLSVLGFDEASAREMLNTDPFVGRPKPSLSPTRFEYKGNFAAGCGSTNEGPYNYGLSTQNCTFGSTSNTSFTAEVTDYKAGFLANLGVGVTETVKVSANTTYAAGSQSTTGESTTATLSLYCWAGDQPYTVDMYVDKAFRTFAFEAGQTTFPPSITGLVRDKFGKTLSSRLVTVLSGGRTYSTYTDAAGHFAIYSAVAPGNVTFKSGTTTRRVTLPKGRQINVELLRSDLLPHWSLIMLSGSASTRAWAEGRCASCGWPTFTFSWQMWVPRNPEETDSSMASVANISYEHPLVLPQLIHR